MKKIFFIVILLFATIATILIGCHKYNEDNFICKCGKVEINKKEYVTMCIIPDIVSENSVNKLRIENHTKKNIIYENPFSIEYFNGNDWNSVEFDFSFTLPLYTLKVGKAIEWNMSLYSLIEKYNDGKKGKYRYIKKVNLAIYPDPLSHYLYAEFEIK
jgi:hypothetical protein